MVAISVSEPQNVSGIASCSQLLIFNFFLLSVVLLCETLATNISRGGQIHQLRVSWCGVAIAPEHLADP